MADAICVTLRAIKIQKKEGVFCSVKCVYSKILFTIAVEFESSHDEHVSQSNQIMYVTMNDFWKYNMKYCQVSYNDPRAF